MKLAGVILAIVLLAPLPRVRADFFNETNATIAHPDGVRIVINSPPIDAKKPTQLILYLLPNGNSIEWTVGCQRGPGLDWHYDIQHIGAQTRRLREIDKSHNIVVAYLEAEEKRWPGWRQKRGDANAALIRKIVDEIATTVGSPDSISLIAHSGGGSFITGYINGGDTIPDHVARIAYLDANYSYDDAQHHGDKLLAWLSRDKAHTLVVLAYDDREVKLNGVNIVSDTGGTYRASHRMIDRLGKDTALAETTDATWERFAGMNGQITFAIHKNPDLKILHTTLVGEMSGYLHALTLNSPLANQWGEFAGPRSWDAYIQPAPATQPSTRPVGIRPRDGNAMGGRAFIDYVSKLGKPDREMAIIAEFKLGNIPAFLRQLKTIRATARGLEGVEHRIEYQVMPDYLAVGSDTDFVRIPMTPMSAQAIADAWGYSMITRQMVNQVYEQSEVKLEPKPLTDAREALTTFVQHNDIIETQRSPHPLGQLVAGIKKDVVITNRLNESPNRVAIYGWHQLDGKPIQPLTIVHKSSYVDYSHGVRLARREVTVDGKPMLIDDVLKDPHLNNLLSDEGVLIPLRY